MNGRGSESLVSVVMAGHNALYGLTRNSKQNKDSFNASCNSLLYSDYIPDVHIDIIIDEKAMRRGFESSRRGSDSPTLTTLFFDGVPLRVI